MATAVTTATVHQNFALNVPITNPLLSTSHTGPESTWPRTRDRLTMAQTWQICQDTAAQKLSVGVVGLVRLVIGAAVSAPHQYSHTHSRARAHTHANTHTQTHTYSHAGLCHPP